MAAAKSSKSGSGASESSTYKKLIAKGMSPKAARAFAAHTKHGKSGSGKGSKKK